MKAVGRILFILVLILGALFLLKDIIVKNAVTVGTQAVTGMKLDIERLNLSVSKALIDIQGIKLHNPGHYPDPVMVNIPSVYVDVDLQKAIKGNIHVEALKLYLKEFIIVKNKNGKVNINELKAVADSKSKGDKPAAKDGGPEKKGEAPKITVDSLHLRLDKVIYKDYSQGGEPVVKEYNINLDENHENIKSLEAVIGLIVIKAVTKTNIAALANIDLQGLQSVVTDTLGKTAEVATQALDKTTDTLKGTAEKLKDTIKLPFGK